MGLRSLGNPLSSFLDVFSETVSEKSTTTGAAELNVFGGNVAGRVVGDWTYHTFTSDGTLTLQNTSVAKDAEFLLVGGGGAGGVANNDGSDGGGGAGAGNVNTYTSFSTADLGDGDFTITVGQGAARFPGPPSPGSTVQAPQVGGDTIVVKDGAELRAKGGGGGGHGPYGGPLGPHGTGGSGGGGGGGGGAAPPHYGPGITNTAQPLLNGVGGITITQRGNQGGYGSNPPYFGGGGGGAGGAAAPGTSSPKGRGGAAAQIVGYEGDTIGVPALNPYNGYYGGGGPGGSGGPGNQPGTDAPANGATPGSPVTNGPRQGGDAAANTGGGGGAASGAPAPPSPGSPGGAGGPGIVVFRYRH